MSAEPVALIAKCEECNRIWLPRETDRWRCYLDHEDNLVFYCPDCAEHEFDDDGWVRQDCECGRFVWPTAR